MMKPNVQWSCREANQIDLTDYLEKLGYRPSKIRGNDFWYLSPFRQENTPSFKVNRKLNLWYDHGTGQGGSLIDFGLLYHTCSVSEFLHKLRHENGAIFSFQPRPLSTVQKDIQPAVSPLQIIATGPIKNAGLIAYLEERKIPLSIVSEYCEEVVFKLYQKKQLAIGFKNDSGGYELRSPNFKGSSSPKEPTLIAEAATKSLSVFEGFFSFLSYKTLQATNLPKNSDLPIQQQDFLVLNSLVFFEKSRHKMEGYENIHLFFDRDKACMAATQKALQWSEKYKDAANFYKSFKDLNEFLVATKKMAIKQSQGKRYRL